MLNYVMVRQGLYILLFFAAAGMFSDLYAEKLYCDQCGNRIKEGKPYITSGEKVYCDMECYEKSLPKCSVCGKPVKSGFVQEGKRYCSEECLSTTWESCSLCGKKVNRGVHFGSRDGVFYCPDCAKKPVCSGCGMPNDCVKLEDGRDMCKKCRATSVTSYREAMEIIRSVRKVLKDEFGFYTKHDIKYRLVDLHELKEISKNQEMELGLYSHEQWKNTEVTSKSRLGMKLEETTSVTMSDSFYIYILTDLPKDKFIEVAAHEHAHDWMEEKYPNIKVPLLCEGWAEYTASLINSYYGNDYMNEKMKNNDNPVYGDGFRLISGIAEKGGTESVLEFLKERNNEKK